MWKTDEFDMCLLYLSELAPDRSAGVVKDIFSLSRRRNPSYGITGALLFDGGRFCQLLEGPEKQVQRLMQCIREDERHVHVEVLGEHRKLDERRLNGWRAGYCDASALDTLEAFRGADGATAIRAFLSVLPGADLE
ncbi:MAG: BLUF domain-containing protein [Burkholderiaceae bacterium]